MSGPSIRILPDHLASQIAAGEVVERPAAVVKELVENALDAGARDIAVDLEAGGRRRIAVGDDGSGMGSEDALLAFDRHATSKIATFADLERVATLGFRGEALASIASVARVELLTHDGENGTRVRIEGGRVRASEPAARGRGTTVEVEGLFFNVPARRKFLKSVETELRRCVEVVQGIALAHPEVAFRLTHDDHQILHLPATAQGLRERIGRLFSDGFSARLVAVGSGRRGTWSGWIGDATTSGGRRQFVWINGRLVRDRAVMAVFYRAVREVWRGEDFPALFLRADLDPAAVDVNVHPQKAEVRFRDGAALAELENVLRRALGGARGVESADALTEVRAVQPLAWGGLGGRTADTLAGEVREGIAQAVWAPLERPAIVPLSGRGEPGVRKLRLLGQYKGTVIVLEGPEGLYLIDQHVAHERVLYERLRRALEEERPGAQRLIEPLWLQVGPAERVRLEALIPYLEPFGFELSALSGAALALTATPAVLDPGVAADLLVTLAGAAGSEADLGPALAVAGLRRRVLDSLAASRACRAAVKMHQPMSPEAIEGLVSELFGCAEPFACPHGRPIVLALSDADLERRFGRR